MLHLHLFVWFLVDVAAFQIAGDTSDGFATAR
jgi:hypothetical protein